MKDFDSPREGTGTDEWAEVTENIQVGCANDCRYCYAAHNANRFDKRKRTEWGREALTKRAEIKSYPARDGVIMIPSAHDITPYNYVAFVRVTRLMLEAGNRLLIVSKPRYACVESLMRAYVGFNENILFRFTIGSMDSDATRFWEPYAPSPDERIESLRLAWTHGYRTSVSAEPILGGVQTASEIVSKVQDLVSDTIWIGKMNKPRLRVDMTAPENVRAVESIERAQSDEEMRVLVEHYRGHPKIRWKDSIRSIMEKDRC